VLVGVVSQDSAGKIRFPQLPPSPGLYQFKVLRKSAVDAIYVGETDNIQRRFSHYRNPGPTQATNLRLNALFKARLLEEARINVEVVTDSAWMTWSGDETQADLSKKSVRRLFENFVLCVEGTDDVESLNR
jgi:hypothetical protein